MENEYSLRDQLLNRIDSAMSDPKNVKAMMLHIQSYADKHSDILLSSNMAARLIFSESDKTVLYKITGIPQADIESAIRKSTVIKSSWRIATNPFYILCVLLIHYFSKKNMAQERDAITVYMSYLLYTTTHKGSFKYLPSKEIMEYTINNLSNRYLIKQVGTIQAMIEHTVIGAMVSRYKNDILDPSDANIKDVLSALETRISSVIKNVANEFYKNHDSGKYLFHEEDNLSEEDFHISDNISYKIDRIVTNTTTSIISNGFDQNTVIKRAVSLNPSVSQAKLESMLTTLVLEDMKSISSVISDILTLFIYKGLGNSIDDVKTMKFVSESLQLYKSNAQDEITARIKAKLIEWIDLTSEKYGRNFISRGKTSLDNYRRALYTCFVFKILEIAK